MADDKLTVAMVAMARKVIEDPSCAQASACADGLMAMRVAPADEASLAALIDAAKIVRLARLSLQDKVREITDPLNAALKAVREQSNGRIATLMAAEGRAKDLKTLYDDGVERKRRTAIAEQEAREIVAAAPIPGEAPVPVASAFVPPAPNKVSGGIGSMHGRQVAKVRVLDMALAIKHNPTLFDLNEGRALQTLKASAPNPVPGLELYYEKSQVLA